MVHITLIHGIGNKPETEALTDIWLRSLADQSGLDLRGDGMTTSMVYWADVIHPAADPNVEDYERVADEAGDDMAIAPDAPPPLSESLDEAEFTTGLAAKVGGAMAVAEALHAQDPAADPEVERVPLPWPLKKLFLNTFLVEVHHYLFNETHSPRPGATYRVQDEIRRRFVETLRTAPAGQKHIVISHSLGTVIAYDCLKRVPDCPVVDGLLTIGSPLGLDEIQDRLTPGWSRTAGFPRERVRGRWVNVFDRLDPVAGFDPFLANDYQEAGGAAVSDTEEANYGTWRHSITKYLRGPKLRAALRDMLG